MASIVQETNTFSCRPSTLADFEAQGLWIGAEAVELTLGTNTEFAGACTAVIEAGAEMLPIMRAWAMSDGILTEEAFLGLQRLLLEGLTAAGRIDGMVLALHGALVAAHEPSADAAFTEAARKAVGPGVPLVVTHDLHANVTKRIVAAASAVIGYHTYPHVDQGNTGRRAAALVLGALGGSGLAGTALAKRAMIVPAEAQDLRNEPMAGLRAAANDLSTGDILDISLFPVQPWLDVPELGFGVTVTYANDAADAARSVAERLSAGAWQSRDDFRIELFEVADAVQRAQASRGSGLVLLVQSADSPTAGATADSATVIGALLEHGRGLTAYATVVDEPAVHACVTAGIGGRVRADLGATQDQRWSVPVGIEGTVTGLGSDPVKLTGDMMTGQEISMGRWATLATDDGLVVLVTERPAPTFDPAGYRHAGLEPADADVVVVRSATMYRAGFSGLYVKDFLLDLPGVSTPRFDYLTFERAPRPLYPIDDVQPE